MTAVIQMQFPDKVVTYDTFVHDLARVLTPMVKEAMKDQSEVISQRQAYKQFGQGNVKRWFKTGKLVPVAKRPGKVEYRIADLKQLQQVQQDYF